MSATQAKSAFGPRREAKGLRSLLFAAVLMLCGGAAVPHLLADKLPAPSGPPADAILVLTGGENRIAEGFRAWKAGKARELFILGAGGRFKLDVIFPGHPPLSPEELRRVHIEGWSENTMENAYSAKSVVRNRGFRRVVLVTSDYHMARAYLALRTLLPAEVSITAIPVRSDWKIRDALPRTLRLHFIEGWKYWVFRFFLLWE